MPTLDARVAALEIAFCGLAKFLGRNQVISVVQVGSVIKDEAKDHKASAETTAAVAALADMLR